MCAQRRRQQPLADSSNPASGEVHGRQPLPRRLSPHEGAAVTLVSPPPAGSIPQPNTGSPGNRAAKRGPSPRGQAALDDGDSAGPTCTERGDLPRGGSRRPGSGRSHRPSACSQPSSSPPAQTASPCEDARESGRLSWGHLWDPRLKPMGGDPLSSVPSGNRPVRAAQSASSPPAPAPSVPFPSPELW